MNTEQLKGLRDAIDARLNGKQWQWRCKNGRHWNAGDESNDIPGMLVNGYDFRAAPEPLSRPWSKPDDVPGPVCWIRKDTRYHGAMIVGITDDAIITSDICELVELTWDRTAKCEYSTDRKTWHKCEVIE